MPHFFFTNTTKWQKKNLLNTAILSLMKQDVIPKLLLCTLISLIQMMCYLQDANTGCYSAEHSVILRSFITFINITFTVVFVSLLLHSEKWKKFCKCVLCHPNAKGQHPTGLENTAIPQYSGYDAEKLSNTAQSNLDLRNLLSEANYK